MEPFAAELISRQYVRKLSQVQGGQGRGVKQVLGELARQHRKVMTNKRIHVSAIVLFIAAIIIDMHNNGLCPLCPWFPLPPQDMREQPKLQDRLWYVATGSG